MSIAALPAQALPGAPVQPAVSVSDVTLVADGCGRGWYRDAYGRCRRMGGGPVVVTPGIAIAPGIAVVPPVVVAPRVVPRGCPRGMYMTRSGRCVWG